jgi:uncharacterized protein (TIGR03083 family)
MALPRETAIAGMVDGYTKFGELIEPLTPEEWQQPTRCEGWTVADVAAHVAGQLTDVVNFRLEGLGTPEVTERQVAERRGRSPQELADELRADAKLGADITATFDDAAWDGPAPGGVPGTLGDGIEALWFDTYVHADDIRAALGRPTQRDDDLNASVSHLATLLTQAGWGPATLALDGVPSYDVSGGGRRITGDAHDFVLAATGRSDPASLGLDETVNVYRA